MESVENEIVMQSASHCGWIWRHPQFNYFALGTDLPNLYIYIYYIIKIIGKKDDQTIISPKYLTKDNYYKHGRYKQTAGYELNWILITLLF